MPDHIHILISIRPDILVSKIVGDLKANSSKWVNEKKYIQDRFQWQEGFGAFSVGYSQLDKVIAYINNQEKHHEKKTFKEEYLELLKKFDVEYDVRYI